MKLEFLLETVDPEKLEHFIVTGNENIDIELVSKTQIGEGFGKAEFAFTLILGIVSGIPAGIIANTIYDKLMDNGNCQLVVKEKKLIIATKDELIQYIETERQKSPSS